MNLLYIGLGILFLANPIVGVDDILPDFIGCYLIMTGIRDASYMIEKLENARRWFKYGSWLSFVRFIVSFIDIESQHTLPLTLAFSFAVVEMIVYIPAFRELFAGFDYAAMRHGGSGVLSIGRRMGYYTDESGKRQYGEIQDDTTGRLAAASLRFMAIRAAASLLPELPALQLSDSENLGDVGGFQFSSVRNLIVLVTVVIVLIPAILLVIRYVRFLRRIHRAGDFIPTLNAELSRRFGDLGELHICTRMRTMSLAAGVAVLLYMGFYDYQVNVIQRYYPAALLCVAAVMLFASSGKRLTALLPVIPAIAAVPLSVRTYRLQYDHYHLYKMQMLSLFESGNEHFYDRGINVIDDDYIKMAITESIEAFVLGVGIVLFLALYLRLTLSHVRTFRSVSDRLRGQIGRSLKIRGGIMIGGGVLTTLYFTGYRFILPFFDLAPIVGILVNIAAAAMFAVFALQANEYVYGNLHGNS